MLTDKEAKSRTESPGLSSTGIKHIAKLARIELSEQEEEKYKNELSSILDFVNKLNEVDTEGVEPLYQTTGLIDSMRSDTSRGEFNMTEDLRERLIGQAPHKENRFIKVRSVLNK